MDSFTWKEFTNEIDVKLFPRAKKQRLMDQFFGLRQRLITMDEYADKFYRLTQLALELLPN